MKLLGINHICFSVAQLERSIVFYEQALGAKLLARGRSVAYFELAGHWLALNEEPHISRENVPSTYTHLAFSVDEADLAAFRERFEQLGVCLLEGRPRQEGDKDSVYFTDPDGHMFELHTGTLADRLTFYRRTKPHMQFFEDSGGAFDIHD